MKWTPALLWNCWIMLNYLGAMLWWTRPSIRNWWDVAYWFFACGITFVVTMRPR